MKGFARLFITFFILFYIIVHAFKNEQEEQSNYGPYDYASEDCPEQLATVYDSVQNKSYYDVTRSWRNFDWDDYCLNYQVSNLATYQSLDHFKAFQPSDQYQRSIDAQFYGEIYQYLYEHDKDSLKPIISQFKNLIALSNPRDLKSLMETVVSFVQDIPYSYVFDEFPCDQREYAEFPCVQGHKYGIITPVNFLASLQGDCDTRALLIYAILKELNYDVKIVVSYEYAHAMIAVHWPDYYGDYLLLGNKRYYFWETTATNWKPGVLPPNCNNPEYWDIAL